MFIFLLTDDTDIVSLVFLEQVEIPECLLPRKYPHYLEKEPDKTFHSSSVLGEIYDTAKAYEPDNSLIKGN